MSSPPLAVGRTRGIHPGAVSSTSTLVTHTGTWKYIRPAYHDRVAPCNEGCPVGIDIEGYMNLLREDRVSEARRLLFSENPMPSVTGRVCHHPCESACNRRLFDEAVSIHAVERMLGDAAMDEPHSEPLASAHPERIAVVGSGPAGLAAAWHLTRFGYRVTVLEAAAKAGGMLRLGIPEYRLPAAVLDRDLARIAALGVEIRCSVRVGTDVTWATLFAQFDAVLIANGAHSSRALGIAGEDGPGVVRGLEFLAAINAGARPAIGRQVVVVGGGNTAMDCARSALRLGADVTVLYRRTRAEMPAIADEVEQAEREGVRFAFLAAPVGFAVVDGALRGIECERMELGAPDASGRRSAAPTGERYILPAQTVLTAIGELSELDTLPGDITRQEAGVRADAFGRTSRVAVFAAGDVTDASRTVADALGSGKRAAIGIDGRLRAEARGDDGGNGKGAMRANGDGAGALRFGAGNMSAARWKRRDPVARVDPLNTVVGFEELNMNHFAPAARHSDDHLPISRASTAFDETIRGLSHEEAMEEARRCFNCGVCNRCDLCLIFCPDAAITRDGDGGAYSIALDYCKGCGVCAAECPRGAMVMTREGL